MLNFTTCINNYLNSLKGVNMKSIKTLLFIGAFASLPVFANSTIEHNVQALNQITEQSVVQTTRDIKVALKHEISLNVKQDVPKLSKKRGAALIARDRVITEVARPLIGE